MKKNKFKFEVSFDLNINDDEKLDIHSIRSFKRTLDDFVRNWSGGYGYFYTYSEYEDSDVLPTNIKIKQIKTNEQQRTKRRRN